MTQSVKRKIGEARIEYSQKQLPCLYSIESLLTIFTKFNIPTFVQCVYDISFLISN